MEKVYLTMHFLVLLGKIVDKVTIFWVKDSIPKLNVKKELIELREEVIKSLSHNQKYPYNITWVNKSGIFLKTWKIEQSVLMTTEDGWS